MADFTAAELLTLRRQYVRDLATAGPPAEYLSHYNRATRVNFSSDADINAIKARTEVDYAEELASLYDDKYYQRLNIGDTDAAAVAAATSLKAEAVYRWVRSEIRAMMMSDPGYIGSIADAAVRHTLFETWRDDRQADRNFLRLRSGGLASIPLYRR